MDAALDYEIEATNLLAAYRAGIFPMAERADDPDIVWMDPALRGIIPLDAFHIPASLKKTLKKRPYKVTINTAFRDVIEACAAQTPVRSETWINAQIKTWFCELHALGHAHSVECRDEKGALAGGLYGLAINGAFFGESMFSQATDASKVALVHLAARLKGRGFKLLDCQFVNPHLMQFGCVEIGRETYHSLLSAALSETGVSFVDASCPSSASSPSVVSCESDWDSLAGSLQSSTVTS